MGTVGILGLGRMGGPIAQRLAGAGAAVVGFDPQGGGAGASVADVGNRSDIVLTVLPGPAEVDAVAPSLLATLRPGTLWVDLTSNDPRAGRRLGALAAERGIDFVGAPLGGGPAEAGTGGLRFFAAGEQVDRARPILDSLGTIEDLGADVAAGYTTKLIVNLLWFGQVIAVTEALLLGRSLGVPVSTLRGILPSTAAGSEFIDSHLDALLGGDYLETFGIARCVEELDILVSLAREGDIPFELSELVACTHRQALETFGSVDGELLAAKLLEQRAGRTLRAET